MDKALAKQYNKRAVIKGVTSEWVSVTSCIPQGSVLGSVFYINDTALDLNNFISKFAGDAKIGNAVLSEDDRRPLQNLLKISD